MFVCTHFYDVASLPYVLYDQVGNADTLNCYYAHGDQNPNFQRRIYWMLDP